MRIVLIEIRGDGHLFLAEPPPEVIADPPPPPARGVRGWFATKRAAFRKELEQDAGFVARTSKRIWTRLQRLIAPDEYLLRGLRVASDLTIDHPSNLAETRVREDWNTYLRRRSLKHRSWMIIDLVLAAPAILLTPLPGPNVICFWFSGRSLMHFLAWRGAARARKGAFTTLFQSRSELDEAVSPENAMQVSELAKDLNFPELAIVLSRLAPKADLSENDEPS